MSSANILLETSKANTISTPWLRTVSSFVPILGFTKANGTKHANAKLKTIIFQVDLNK